MAAQRHLRHNAARRAIDDFKRPRRGHFMRLSLLILTPLLLCAEDPPDRVTELVETMRQLAFAGNEHAVGLLVPTLIQALAKPHPEGALAWNQVGTHHAVQGNFTEAEHAYRRGIQLAERAGTSRGTLALLLLNLGQLYLETGADAGQAKGMVRRALNLAEESYNVNSVELSSFIYVLGVAQKQSGNRKDARRQFERALLLAGHTRDGRIGRGLILANLAVLHAEDKQWNEAEDAILQALALLKDNFGVAHPALVPAYINLARIQRQFKQWDRASQALRRARVITETQLGPGHRYMVVILLESAFISKKSGRSSDAREQARRAKSIAASLPDSSVGETWIHISDLRR